MQIEAIWLKFKSKRTQSLKKQLAEYYHSFSDSVAKRVSQNLIAHPLFDMDDACSVAYLIVLECIDKLADNKTGTDTYDTAFRKLLSVAIKRRIITEYESTCNELGKTNIELKQFLSLVQNNYYLHHGIRMNDLQIKAACNREKELRAKDKTRTAKRSSIKMPTPWILARLQMLDRKHRLSSFAGLPTYDKPYNDEPSPVNDFLDTLSHTEMHVLRMYLNDSSYEHIAASLGEDLRFVDNALQRTKRKVRSYLPL